MVGPTLRLGLRDDRGKLRQIALNCAKKIPQEK
jgi:hypothetical protein